MVRYYGKADLEHGAAIDAATLFEAGSVSKQFTAAAVLLLVADGKLALTDDVRRYIPELPDYGHVIHLAELLGHTSGLRDWGEVEAIAGWPRTSRVYTMQEVLAVIARQAHLNYAPGTAYSYTNSGYNLLALIVERVSGQSLQRFSHDRLFKPLGMTQTRWRDNFRQVLPGRAIAYDLDEGVFLQNMPFENSYGNGGLLTTVGDLLRWNAALNAGTLGKEVTAQLQQATLLNDGHATDYARGLILRSYRGYREFSHSGITAGYTSWLGRYPETGLSIAMLCNRSDVDNGALAHAVANHYLPSRPSPIQEPDSHKPSISAQDLSKLAGRFVNVSRGMELTLTMRDAQLTDGMGEVLRPQSATNFSIGRGTLHFVDGDHLRRTLSDGSVLEFQRVVGWKPLARELEALAGNYVSNEALAVYRVAVIDGLLTMTPLDRPSARIRLQPLAPDLFAGDENAFGGVVQFKRDERGTSTAFEVHEPRVHGLRFDRVLATGAPH